MSTTVSFPEGTIGPPPIKAEGRGERGSASYWLPK